MEITKKEVGAGHWEMQKIVASLENEVFGDLPDCLECTIMEQDMCRCLWRFLSILR